MFQKVLIAEDFDTINLAVAQVLGDMDIKQVAHAKYCDDALLKIKKALFEYQPYDLLISDLSFKDDFRQVNITTGEALIQQVRMLQPNIPVIVYSVEEKAYRIQSLFDNQKINAYVTKGAESIRQLKQAMHTVAKGEDDFYISPELAHSLQNRATDQIDQFDIGILKHLAQGVLQEDMEFTFKQKGITPNSKSTIEKRISKLKIIFRANNTIHLIAITKDMGII